HAPVGETSLSIVLIRRPGGSPVDAKPTASRVAPIPLSRDPYGAGGIGSKGSAGVPHWRRDTRGPKVRRAGVVALLVAGLASAGAAYGRSQFASTFQLTYLP